MPKVKTRTQKIDDETKKLIKDLAIRYVKCYEANVLSILNDYNKSDIKLIEKQNRKFLRVKSFKELSKLIIDSLELTLKQVEVVESFTRMDFELIITNLSLSIFLFSNAMNHNNCKSSFNPSTTYLLRSNALELHRNFFALLVTRLINIWKSKYDHKLKNLQKFETDQDYLDFLTDKRHSEDSRKSMSSEDRILQTLGYHYLIGVHFIAIISSEPIDYAEIKDETSSLEKDLDDCFKIDKRKFSGLFFYADGLMTSQTKTVIDFKRIEKILIDITKKTSKMAQRRYAAYLLTNRIQQYKITYTIDDFKQLGSTIPKISLENYTKRRLEFLEQYKSDPRNLKNYLQDVEYDGVQNPARARKPLIKEIARRLKRGE